MFFQKKCLTTHSIHGIIYKVRPRPVGQGVKTLPSHGRNRSSILLRATTSEQVMLAPIFFVKTAHSATLFSPQSSLRFCGLPRDCMIVPCPSKETLCSGFFYIQINSTSPKTQRLPMARIKQPCNRNNRSNARRCRMCKTVGTRSTAPPFSPRNSRFPLFGTSQKVA